jgi:hypothetical protein
MKVHHTRIRYEDSGISKQILTPHGMMQIKLNKEEGSFSITNHVGYEVANGKSKSLAGLKKKAKSVLCKLTGIQFKKEAKPSRQGKRIGGIISK